MYLLYLRGFKGPVAIKCGEIPIDVNGKPRDEYLHKVLLTEEEFLKMTISELMVRYPYAPPSSAPERPEEKTQTGNGSDVDTFYFQETLDNNSRDKA